jgi:putative drug exporter of the RND superfamily
VVPLGTSATGRCRPVGARPRQTRSPLEGSAVFSRLGNWCHDHRRLVLGLWVAILFVGGALQAAGNSFRDEINLPDSESRTGFDILDEHFGGEGTGINGTIVFQAPQGVTDPEVEAQMQALFDRTRTAATWASPPLPAPRPSR